MIWANSAPLEQSNKNVGPVAQWRADFFAGLAIVLPGMVSVGVVVWLFGNVSKVTDMLLFFVPTTWTHSVRANGEPGEIFWYWSLIALLWAVFLISLIGRYGRNYLGRKAIEWTDSTLMQVPFLNKIYGTVKQVNESFANNKASFKHVALVAFPHPSSRSVGFVTGEQIGPSGKKLLSVFVPTTPNPTSGFLVFAPEDEVTILDMSVADGIKFIISLGTIPPEAAASSVSALAARSGAKMPS